MIENDQLFVDGADIDIPGLRLVISQQEERPAAGDLDYLYEATILTNDADGQPPRQVYDLRAIPIDLYHLEEHCPLRQTLPYCWQHRK